MSELIIAGIIVIKVEDESPIAYTDFLYEKIKELMIENSILQIDVKLIKRDN